MEKSPDAFRTISEVADDLEVPKHVLRFWEGKFAQLRPMKRGGGRRYYRPEDVELLRGIRRLLYDDGYTIKGVQKILREQGVRHVMDLAFGRIHPEAGDDDVELPDLPDIPDIAAEARRGSAAPGQPVEAIQSSLSRHQIKQLDAVLKELEACRELLAASRSES